MKVKSSMKPKIFHSHDRSQFIRSVEQIDLISQVYCSLHLKLPKLCTMVALHDIERRQFNLQSGRDEPLILALTTRTLSHSRTILFTKVESMAIRVENSNPPISRWS